LAGVSLIIHAGDVGGSEVLDALRTIAPVHAVRGNIDQGDDLPERLIVPVGEARLFVLHNLADLDVDPAALGYQAVIYGHSHRPAESWRDGVLYLNPGSAGPRRFRLPVTVARLDVAGTVLKIRLVPIDC
jgi:putative phosphoesterase